MFGSRPAVSTYPYGAFVEDYEYQGNIDQDALETTFTVQVSSATNTGSGGRYYISGGLTGNEEFAFNFRKGRKYIFNQSDASNTNHAMLFSTYGEATAQGWHVLVRLLVM